MGLIHHVLTLILSYRPRHKRKKAKKNQGKRKTRYHNRTIDIIVDNILKSDPLVSYAEVYSCVKRDYKDVFFDVPEALSKQRLRKAVIRSRNKSKPLSGLAKWQTELNQKMKKEVVRIVKQDDDVTLKHVELEYPAAVNMVEHTYKTFQVYSFAFLFLFLFSH